MIILLVIIFLVISLISPKIFLVFYILHYTKYFGLFDNIFLVNSIDVGSNILNYIALFSVIYNLKKSVFVVRKEVPFLAFAFLFAFLIPIFFFEQSLLLSFIGSKQFHCLLILMYLTIHSQHISINYIIRILIFTGLTLSLLQIIYIIFSVAPPFYIIDGSFRLYSPVLISLSSFLIYYRLLTSYNIFYLGFLLLSLFGLYHCNHLSIFLTTTILISAHFIVLTKYIHYGKALFRLMIFSSIAFIFLKMSDIDLFNSYSNSGSIQSRITYNEFRRDAISDSPIFGHGFMHHKNPYVNSYIPKNHFENRFMSKFEVIDSGYIDILIKFGWVGGIIYIICWALVFFKTYDRKNLLCTLLSLFFFQYFFVNITWSLFTHQIGLMPLLIVLHILYNSSHHNRYYLKNKYNKIGN